MVAGDICNILAGTYREQVSVLNSGSSSSPITFMANGSDIVTIDGTESVSNWTNTGENIWSASMPWTLEGCNQVFIKNEMQQNEMQPEARWPNVEDTFPWQDSSAKNVANWSYVDSAEYAPDGTSRCFVDAQLPSNIDWTGAIVNILSGNGWVMKSLSVTGCSRSEKKITTKDANGNSPEFVIMPGNEYYLTGKKEAMDNDGEWFYDKSNSALSVYYRTCLPEVTAKQRYYGFDLSGKKYVCLKNLHFFACTIKTDVDTSNITYDGLSMQYLGHSQQVESPVYGLTLHNNDVLKNSMLSWDSRGLVQIAGSNILIFNNNFSNSGYMPWWTAMVDSADPGYLFRDNISVCGNLISHNTLIGAGRAAMGFPGRDSIVEYNYMSDAMKLTTDGAIFYTNGKLGGGAIVRYNLMRDSYGPQGHTGAPVHGFYLDFDNSNWIIHHNIISGVPGYCMWLNCRQNFNMIFNNTCANGGEGSLGSTFPSGGETGTRVFNNLFNGPLTGSVWSEADVRYNLFSDPGFVAGTFQLGSNSPGIDQGIDIPGVTDVCELLEKPDFGALERGATDWTQWARANLLNPSSLPIYVWPTMPFANQVKNGGFEEMTIAPWSVVNGSANIIKGGNGSTFWNSEVRSGRYALKFAAGSTEVKQMVSGLQPNKRYKAYFGVRRLDGNSTVTLGVRHHGFPTVSRTADVVNRTAILGPNETMANDGAWWTMYGLPFVTGSQSSSAEIYLSVNATSSFVYADDFCVQLMDDPGQDPVLPMPYAAFPFNEGNGTLTVFDSTTNGRDGTVSGNGTRSENGVSGKALVFDGTDDYVTVPGSVSSNRSFTVSTWVKFDSSVVNPYYTTLVSNNNGAWAKKGWQIKVSRPVGTSDFSVGFYFLSSDGEPTAQNKNTYAVVWLSQKVPAEKWAHVAFVVDWEHNVLTGYLNGVQAGSASLPSGITADTTLATRLGGSTGDQHLKGQLDDVRIYDVALNSDEVRAIKNSDPDKRLHLEFNEQSGATRAYDSSGNANNGDLKNMDSASVWAENALKFDGQNDYVSTPSNVPTVSYGSFTVSTWVKFNRVDSSLPYVPALVSNNDGRWAKQGWQIKVSNASSGTGFKIGFYMWSDMWPEKPDQAVTWLTPVVKPEEWIHVVFVVSRDPVTGAGTITGYLNGVMNSTATLPNGFGNVATDLGTRVGGSGTQTLNGQLDDVRTYSRALKWEEVLDLAKPQDGPPY